MLAVNKAVTLASSDGAAATVIDASTVNVLYNVAVTANGTHFGKPGLGFMVTDTASLSNCFGIDLASVSDVNVRGNLVVSFSSGCHSPGNSTTGSVATGTDPGGGLIEGNQVMGWPSAINVGANIVNQNVVQFNGLGITGFGAAVTGNVVTDNYVGIVALKGSVTGNAVRGNRTIGIEESSFEGPPPKIESNNVFGNGCGISFSDANDLATNNYWGRATGPRLPPLAPVDVCGNNAGTAIVTPFATMPFNITAPVNP